MKVINLSLWCESVPKEMGGAVSQLFAGRREIVRLGMTILWSFSDFLCFSNSASQIN